MFYNLRLEISCGNLLKNPRSKAPEINISRVAVRFYSRFLLISRVAIKRKKGRSPRKAFSPIFIFNCRFIHQTSSFSPQTSYIGIGPCPMQLVVVIAVRNAVSAATITFTTVSRKSFLFIVYYFFFRPRIAQIARIFFCIP